MTMKQSAYYMLRKTLPLWKAEETIVEITSFARRNRVDEVIWKIDVEEFSHGLLPLKMIREYLPHLDRARRDLGRHGIKSSVNPWVTLCHGDGTRNAARYHPRMRMFVNGNGVSHACRACPMDKVWQTWLIDAYKLYASTKPEILWLEDDLTNNPKECRGEHAMEYGCFCPAHLAEISRVSGRDWTRETLLEAMKKPGPPHPVRKLWFDLHGRTMIRLAGKLEPGVHAVSRKTRLGLMCSWSNDGRWWDEFVRKISGNLRPVVRPSLSSYHEVRPTVHLFDITDTRKECRCVPAESQICPELENIPYTVFTKSTRLTRLEMGLLQLMGYPAITINIFDHLGTPVRGSMRYDRFLKQVKPKLDGVARRAAGAGKEKGVGIVFRKEIADFMHLKAGQTTMDLLACGGGDVWARILQGAGIAVKWHEDADVLSISGQVLRACRKEEIERFLSRGVLLDGSAVEVLCERGFADHLGCAFTGWSARHDLEVVAEELGVGEGSRRPPRFSTLQTPVLNRIGRLTLNPEARVLTWLVDKDRQRKAPGLHLFTNRVGGRVAVYPIDLSAGIGDREGFLDWHRKKQLESVIRWLGRGKVDLFVEGGAWMIPIRRDFRDHVFVGLVNLETDGWEDITLTLATDLPVTRVRRVGENGAWKSCRATVRRLDSGNVRIAIAEGLDYMDFTAFVIE